MKEYISTGVYMLDEIIKNRKSPYKINLVNGTSYILEMVKKEAELLGYNIIDVERMEDFDDKKGSGETNQYEDWEE